MKRSLKLGIDFVAQAAMLAQILVWKNISYEFTFNPVEAEFIFTVEEYMFGDLKELSEIAGNSVF